MSYDDMSFVEWCVETIGYLGSLRECDPRNSLVRLMPAGALAGLVWFDENDEP